MTRRLLLGYLTVTVLVLVLLEVPLGVVYGGRERDRFAADVERDARVLATIYEDAVERGDVPDDAPARAYEARTGARVLVVDADGISLVDTELGTDRDYSTRPEIGVALDGRLASGTRHSDTLGTELLYVAVPIASGGTIHGALRLTLDAGVVDRRVHRFWLGLAAVGVVIVGVMALVGWTIARSVSRPIRELHTVAVRFGSGDLRPPEVAASGPAEVRALGETLRTMAARLDELLAEQRAFVADASHQLRTPLTALRLRLENVLSREDDPATQAELELVVDEVNRLASLVGDLLRLARADAHPPADVVDVTALVLERVDTWSAIAELGEVRLRAEGVSSPHRALAVPGAVEQVLDNVLDNALAHSPPGTTVTITVSATSPPAGVGVPRCDVTVADQGPGLSPADRERAVQRFWRGEPGRPGSGLGLAIARSLAQASGGDLRLDAAASGGLAVTLSLPAVG